jgi:intraflagellar transport protein 46
LGLRYLDEPCSNQSDPTVLELQLRAKTKKLQYGDIAIRSIEYAEKYPNKIEKWIQDIKDLHRSKPPPQVIYKKSMPDIEQLMEIWSEEFELLLSSTTLPSPDLDLNLFEYTKILCSILDIPIYDNIIESLHVMLSLFIDFRNNPHFQARLYGNNNNNNGADNNGSNSDGINQADGKNNIGRGMISSYENNYGHADVLEIAQDEYK